MKNIIKDNTIILSETPKKDIKNGIQIKLLDMWTDIKKGEREYDLPVKEESIKKVIIK